MRVRQIGRVDSSTPKRRIKREINAHCSLFLALLPRPLTLFGRRCKLVLANQILTKMLLQYLYQLAVSEFVSVIPIVDPDEHFRIRRCQQQHALLRQDPAHLTDVATLIAKMLKVLSTEDKVKSAVRKFKGLGAHPQKLQIKTLVPPLSIAYRLAGEINPDRVEARFSEKSSTVARSASNIQNFLRAAELRRKLVYLQVVDEVLVGKVRATSLTGVPVARAKRICASRQRLADKRKGIVAKRRWCSHR